MAYRLDMAMSENFWLSLCIGMHYTMLCKLLLHRIATPPSLILAPGNDSHEYSFPGSYPASPASLDPLLVRQKTAQTLSPQESATILPLRLSRSKSEKILPLPILETRDIKLTSHLHPAFGLCWTTLACQSSTARTFASQACVMGATHSLPRVFSDR
jgi:hypothetical protein